MKCHEVLKYQMDLEHLNNLNQDLQDRLAMLNSKNKELLDKVSTFQDTFNLITVNKKNEEKKRKLIEMDQKE